MGKVEWKPSKSWLPKKVSALLTLTRSTAMPGKRALIACSASCAKGYPRQEWWFASVREWQWGGCSLPWDAWECLGSSCSLEGKAPSVTSLPALYPLSCRQSFCFKTAQFRLPGTSIFTCLMKEKRWQGGRADLRKGVWRCMSAWSVVLTFAEVDVNC